MSLAIWNGFSLFHVTVPTGSVGSEPCGHPGTFISGCLVVATSQPAGRAREREQEENPVFCANAVNSAHLTPAHFNGNTFIMWPQEMTLASSHKLS